jgi:hypothetical protein
MQLKILNTRIGAMAGDNRDPNEDFELSDVGTLHAPLFRA